MPPETFSGLKISTKCVWGERGSNRTFLGNSQRSPDPVAIELGKGKAKEGMEEEEKKKREGKNPTQSKSLATAFASG